MPVPDSSYSRRYGGREDSSSTYATYSSTRTTPSNRSSYLYNQKLTSTLPPRPSYERKSSESSMPVSRFLNSSTSAIPRSSANYISTTSSSRTLSPIPTSVSSYRRTFDGVPSVTDRIKSLEIGGLEKDLFSNGTSSRFLAKVRERNQQERDRETSVKPLSLYNSRDRSGSGEFLTGSSMILRERGGSEMHRPTGDYSNRFDPRLRATSVMGRASSPTPSTTSTSSYANRKNGYSRLDSSEVTPTSSSDTTTTTTTTNSSTSKSVPIVVATAASNNATANSVVENGVANSKDDVECHSSKDVENHNRGSCNGARTGVASNATNHTASASTNAETSLPIIVKNHKHEQNGHGDIVSKAKLAYNSRSNSLTNQNDVNNGVHVESKPQVDQAIKQSQTTGGTASRTGSTSPEKDSNGNTIVPVSLKKKGAVEEKIVAAAGADVQGSLRSAGSPPRNGKDTCNGSELAAHANYSNNNLTKPQSARRSSVQSKAGTMGPKVIYHTIKVEDEKTAYESQQQETSNAPKPGKLNDAHFRHLNHSNDSRSTEIDQQQSINCNGDESQVQLPHLPSSKEENRNRSRETTPLLSVPAKLPIGSEATDKKFSTQDKVRLVRSSRSPSPAPSSSSSSSSSSTSSPHLPTITKTNNLTNGGSQQHVDEMGGPHCSKHLNGGAVINGEGSQYAPSTLDSISPSSRVGGYESPGSSSGSTRPRIRYNNSSDSSDNDSDASSPNIGRFRSTREKEKGLSGLRNIGNTCFMNSVIQCLSNTKPLLEYLNSSGYSSDINTSSNMRGALMRAFASVIQELWSDSKSVVDTSAFKDQIQRFAPRFMGYSQQDAQEFLRYLLEGLHEDVNRVTSKPPAITTEIDDSLSDGQKAAEAWKRYLRFDDSKIVDLFVGQFKSTLKCTSCGHCSVTFDPFWDLSLSIPSKAGQTRLSQCLELFTREEVLDGDEKPTCSKCQTRRRCTKSLSIQKFPKVLVIHLKRFSPMERYRGKLNTTVDFPMTGLDMSPYAANRGQGATYNLYGVSNHSGSTYSGHYIAYCKHPYSGEWYCYNDSRVSPMSPNGVVSSDGYVLFYELASQSSHL